MTKSVLLTGTTIALALSIGCAQAPDVEKLPVGTEVQVTRQDGGVVEGKLAERDAKQVTVVSASNKKSTTVARDQIADVQVVTKEKPAELPPVAKFREYTVPADTRLSLTLETAVSSETSNVEDPVEARLTEAVRIDGVEVLPAGAIVRGTVSAAQSAGKVKGRASLGLHFTTIVVRDERLAISARLAMEAASTKKRDATKIGIGAAAGAIIGGLFGGGKGAATGAAVGGGAGTAVVLTSEGKPVELAKGAEIHVTIADALDVKVPVR